MINKRFPQILHRILRREKHRFRTQILEFSVKDQGMHINEGGDCCNENGRVGSREEKVQPKFPTSRQPKW